MVKTSEIGLPNTVKRKRISVGSKCMDIQAGRRSHKAHKSKTSEKREVFYVFTFNFTQKIRSRQLKKNLNCQILSKKTVQKRVICHAEFQSRLIFEHSRLLSLSLQKIRSEDLFETSESDCLSNTCPLSISYRN